MYYKDLTNYSYDFQETRLLGIEDIKALNVGWLAKQHKYPKGEVSDAFIKKLYDIIKIPVNIMRGFHDCPFCDEYLPGGGIPLSDSDDFRLGSAEIKVRSASGKIYRAPNLIYHYVTVHHYLPPKEFQDAVLSYIVPV